MISFNAPRQTQKLGFIMPLSLGFFTSVILAGCVNNTSPHVAPVVASVEAAAQAQPANFETISLPPAPDRDTILSVIDNYFEAIATGDSSKIKQMVSRDAISVTSYPEAPGRPVRYAQARAIADQLSEPNAPKIEEPYWNPIVLQRKTMAVVWTPYEVWVNERLSHCGIDVFTLTYQKTSWRLDSIHSTQEPSACEELWPEGRSKLRPKMFNDNG